MKRLRAETISAIAVAVVAVAATAGAVLLNALHFAEALGCEVQERARLPSPSGQRLAIVYDMACGATTADSTHVAIASATERSRLPVAAPVLVVTPTGGVTAIWDGDSALSLSVPVESKILRMLAESGGVTLRHGAAP